ncbi:MAG: signal peptidase I [Bacilli bacterium]|nr:signal peptidase I [Bacilli bacterium]
MKEKLKEIFGYIIVIVLVLVIKQFIITPIRVNGSSMNDTLINKDIMILDKISYQFSPIERFDIVVIKFENEYLIKRVIGLPGETVEYKDNNLYINGELIEENFNHKVTDNYSLNEVIPDGYYFVVGDNRGDSLDSRVLGLMKEEDILGKTSLVLFPFNRFGVKE